MSWLRKKNREKPPPAEDDAFEQPECAHITLIPKWDSVDDMGHEDRASSFQCEACGAEFTGDEGLRLRQTEKERIQRRIAS